VPLAQLGEPAAQALLEDPVDLSREAGQADHRHPVDRQLEAGRQPRRVAVDARPDRDPHLAELDRRHLGPAGEELLQAAPRRLVHLDVHPAQPRDHVHGQVILGGPEPPGADHQVRSRGCLRQRSHDIGLLIVAARHPPRRDIEAPKPLCEVRGVGVDDLATAQLIPDRQDLCTHANA
jgi:hypothetical protein